MVSPIGNEEDSTTKPNTHISPIWACKKKLVLRRYRYNGTNTDVWLRTLTDTDTDLAVTGQFTNTNSN